MPVAGAGIAGRPAARWLPVGATTSAARISLSLIRAGRNERRPCWTPVARDAVIDERAPCPICQSTFRGLCAALDAVRSEAAELRVAQYRRRVDCPPIAERAPSPTSATVRELRLELADAQQQIAELERANRHWRDLAAADRSRAAGAEDALRRSYRVALGVVARRA
ncbi:MAG TPA: hypothetical protein VEL51_23125 [Vicinamibacterales bacterium]|nr:hypothetical protein [Vicinamibacterales bacterium]